MGLIWWPWEFPLTQDPFLAINILANLGTPFVPEQGLSFAFQKQHFVVCLVNNIYFPKCVGASHSNMVCT
jgi:hypothetical protein